MSFRIAEKQAKKSTFEKHKLGATIVKGHRVLSTGYNEIKYSGITRFSTVHAEEAAILKLLKNVSSKTLQGLKFMLLVLPRLVMWLVAILAVGAMLLYDQLEYLESTILEWMD